MIVTGRFRVWGFRIQVLGFGGFGGLVFRVLQG